MTVILGIDTSGRTAYAALLRGGEVCAEASSPDEGRAEAVARLIDCVLREGKAAPGELTAIAVASGPGSFTGIRTGIASAQGIAGALNLPVVAVSVLLARIARRLAPGETAIPVLTASPSEYFYSAFTCRQGQDGQPLIEVNHGISVCAREDVESLAADFPGGRIDDVDAVCGPAAAVGWGASAALRGSEEMLRVHYQCSPLGLGLSPVYGKGVSAKTVEQRRAEKTLLAAVDNR